MEVKDTARQMESIETDKLCDMWIAEATLEKKRSREHLKNACSYGISVCIPVTPAIID